MAYTAGKRSRICSPWGVWEGDRIVTECMHWSFQDAEQHAKDLNREADRVRTAEAIRLRPLLEKCEALVRAQLHLNQRLRRPDDEAGALLGGLLADLRRELGLPEDGPC